MNNHSEDGPDERAALSAALFNALESYEATRSAFSRKDQKIHAKQCELIRQHAAQLLAGQPGAVDEREVWAIPVRYNGKRTTFYTETLPFCPGLGVEQLGEPVRMIEARAALAPAAVVMPERMTTIPEGKTISYAAGYEDALDAVASLNRTVPLELLDALVSTIEHVVHDDRVPNEVSQECAAVLLKARAILAGAKP